MEWSIIVTLLFGAIFGLAASLLTLNLTTKASEQAEERAATRKLGEEQREWVRKSRSERMQPVFDFLALAKEAIAASAVDDMLQGVEVRMEAQLAEIFPEPSEGAKRKVGEAVREIFDPAGQQFDKMEFRRRAMKVLSTASNRDVRTKLFVIMMTALVDSKDEQWRTGLSDLVREAEEAVDRYIVEA